MKTLTLHSDNEDNLRLIRELAEKLGMQSEETSEGAYSGERMAQALEALAQNVDISRSIPDPVAWQREIRKDRKLPGRD